ncbi:hypothetical protein [Alloalcanivorax balearicus]
MNTSSYTNENQSLRTLLMGSSRLRPILHRNRLIGGNRDGGRRYRATGITQYLTGVAGTFGTLTANPKFPTKITQAVAAIHGRFPYMTVSDAVAETNVHATPTPQSLKGRLTLMRIIINTFL